MSTDAEFIVIAEFHLHPGCRDRFLEHARDDARQSLANETGCHAFDVLASTEADEVVFLHEAYTDRAAFDRHTQTPHYQTFREGIAPLLVSDPRVCLTTPA